MKEYIFYLKKHWYIPLILFIIVIGLFVFNSQTIKTKEVNINKNLAIVEDNKIKVDLKGYVANPGLYELEEGSRLVDVINIAGGLLTEADTNTINLSKILFDEMVVIVYSKEEIKSMTEGNTTIKVIDKECNCPVVLNDACPEDVITNLPEENVVDNKISINFASITELDQLPGIGLSKAQDIIDYRETNGLFKIIEDIKNVSGIGDAIFEKIKDLIKI